MRAGSTCSVPNVSTNSPTGRRLADRVRHLHLDPLREARGDGVLRDPPHRVRGRAVDLRRVLARERAAAVAGEPAVGVDDDLPAGKARVAHRAADHEAPGRVDQQPVVRDVDAEPDQLRPHHLVADVRGEHAVEVDVGRVLAGDDDRVQLTALVPS